MDEFETYSFEFQSQTYNVRSNEGESVVYSVFDRLEKELNNVKAEQNNLSQHEELLLTSLNIVRTLLNLEEENKLLLELLNAE